MTSLLADAKPPLITRLNQALRHGSPARREFPLVEQKTSSRSSRADDATIGYARSRCCYNGQRRRHSARAYTAAQMGHWPTVVPC